MNVVREFLRATLRLFTLVLTIGVVVFILVGGLWYIWQDARGKAPQVGYQLTVKKLEKAGIQVYLSSKGDAVTRPANPADATERTFTVKSGETVATVGKNLEKMGLISDASLFGLLVRYNDADQDIQAGVYALRPNMTMEEIMRQLQHGRLPAQTVTIPEGWRAEEIAALLEKVGVVNGQDFLDAVNAGRSDYDFLSDRPAGSPASLEGYLFPDTYQLPEGSTPARVLDIMLQDLNRRLPSPEERVITGTEKLTFHEVMTLASIVEREAVLPEERPLIAGVYLNRLQAGMYLQADPTVQYAKGYNPAEKKWWSTLSAADTLGTASAYNTYTNPGLPPGPICNPGLASILAVLHPQESNYLYFVHKGDGAHAFAATYEEHVKNVEQYSKTP